MQKVKINIIMRANKAWYWKLAPNNSVGRHIVTLLPSIGLITAELCTDILIFCT
jgi:hypothetical protein